MVSAASPAAYQLLKLRDDKEAKYLPEDQDQSFHHTTAQQLFMCSRSGIDIQTLVALITKRVNKPDDYD